MKTLSYNLREHLKSEFLTVCTLWKITRTDGVVFGFTDCSHDLTYLAQLYSASTGHVPSNIKTTSSLSVDNLEIQSVLDSSTITESDIHAGLWDFADVEIMLVNYMSLADGHMMLRKGWLGNVSSGRHNFIAELRGMTQPLQQSIGRVFSPSCDAELGDALCTVSAAGAPNLVSGTVTTATNNRQFTDTSLVQASGFFTGGVVTFLTGANAGYAMEIKSFAAGVVILQQYMGGAIAIGDTFTIRAGCDKLLATCKTKFNNVVNFRGFPHVPGQDMLISGKA